MTLVARQSNRPHIALPKLSICHQLLIRKHSLRFYNSERASSRVTHWADPAAASCCCCAVSDYRCGVLPAPASPVPGAFESRYRRPPSLRRRSVRSPNPGWASGCCRRWYSTWTSTWRGSIQSRGSLGTGSEHLGHRQGDTSPPSPPGSWRTTRRCPDSGPSENEVKITGT